jgi:hypothetical protein
MASTFNATTTASSGEGVAVPASFSISVCVGNASNALNPGVNLRSTSGGDVANLGSNSVGVAAQ